MSKKKIIGIAVAIVIIIAGIIAATMLLGEDKLLSAVESGDVETAVAYYNEKVAQNDSKVEKYKEIFAEKLDSIWNDFSEQKIDFETAEAQARTIKELNIMPKADETYEKIVTLNDSRIAMAAGEKAFENGEYKDAIIEFNKVTDSSLSEKAEEELKKSIEKYKTQFNSEFEKALKGGYYDTAKGLFEEMIEVLPYDKDFRNEQEQKIVNKFKFQLEHYEDEMYNAIDLSRALWDFISDEYTHDYYDYLLVEAWAWYQSKFE
jgi:flagellar basal body-associated protein FliL